MLYLNKKDKINSFEEFKPDEQLKEDCRRRGQNIIISRTDGKFVCVFMTDTFSECTGSIVVHDKSTLCSPLVIEAYKFGVRMTLSSIINPNNGLSHFISKFYFVILYSHGGDEIRVLRSLRFRDEVKFLIKHRNE